MGINEIIVYLMVIFMVIGAIDKCLNGKLRLGEKFEEGINAMGSLTLGMVGIIVIAPVLAKVLSPIIVPIYGFLGADPAMFATSLLAIDMGGYQLALEMAGTEEAGLFSGVILGSMMGATIVFSIPVSLGIIRKEDHKFLATGIMAGMIAIPVGCFIGGMVAGFSIGMILSNLVPIILVAILLALGLWKIPEKMIKGFTIFGHGVVIVAILGLAIGIIHALTPLTLIPGTAPIEEGIAIVGSIAIVLAGAYVMVEVIVKLFNKPLMKLGKFLGMNEVSAAGMVATLANNIPMFAMMKDMDNRGKIINVAFSVCAAFVIGDHLGFAAGVAQDMIFSMIVGKLVGGVTAIIFAIFITNNMYGKPEKN
ncbi:ethanolamine utilization protein EutH [Robertmurraya sp. DFI.2.37]|uniref:ethanolamine utilization protein EutH n=1 Tax=Robertmurraya sp. DFI.2.37 TaxID=3031819 RepID=UPI0023DB1F9C|nr:ethanolamine utilization protein EutH [Robertmurraya sp. DFI.2.37]MDF1510017.1 ethanolamine utilization protein EutH [Robertmurraya sp. DFI.2.37]